MRPDWRACAAGAEAAIYDADHLAKAVDECLGPTGSRKKLKDVRKGLIVPAINWVNGQTEIYISAFLGKAHASDATLRDVCLATSAAPTYFHVPSRRHAAFENMDVASDDTRAALLDAGTATARTGYKNHQAFVDRILSDRRRP